MPRLLATYSIVNIFPKRNTSDSSSSPTLVASFIFNFGYCVIVRSFISTHSDFLPKSLEENCTLRSALHGLILIAPVILYTFLCAPLQPFLRSVSLYHNLEFYRFFILGIIDVYFIHFHLLLYSMFIDYRPKLRRIDFISSGYVL